MRRHSFGLVGRNIEASGPAAELPGEARPERRVLAAHRMQIPAAASATIPHGAPRLALQGLVIGGLHLRSGLKATPVVALHLNQRIQHIADLRLDHVHHGAMPEAGVRPHQEEEVRKARYGRPLISLGAVLPGSLGEIHPAATEDRAGRDRVGRFEAGAEDDRIDLALNTIAIYDAVFAHLPNAAGNHVYIRLRQRRIVVVRDQYPLAAEHVIRRDLAPQFRILDVAANMPQRQQLRQLHDLGMDGEAQHPALQHGVDGAAQSFLRGGKTLEQAALDITDTPVGLRNYPRWSALIKLEARNLGLDFRHELDGRSPGADHRHALSVERVVMVPLLGVKSLTLEALQPL